MNGVLAFLTDPLPPQVAAWLAAASFLGSFMTAALGIGGGAFLLAVMASLVPPAALIPLHGVIQFGSNFFRAAMLVRHVYWKPVAAFAAGSAVGVALGGSVVISLPPAFVQIGVGAFVIWSVFARAPGWLSTKPVFAGGISSFLTMFFGATGLFVANFTKALALPRHQHVATHGVLMTLQHVMKTLAFGALGFAFAPWLGFLLLMIVCGLAGTLAGKLLLDRLTDRNFKRALDLILVALSLRLIWRGVFDLIG